LKRNICRDTLGNTPSGSWRPAGQFPRVFGGTLRKAQTCLGNTVSKAYRLKETYCTGGLNNLGDPLGKFSDVFIGYVIIKKSTRKNYQPKGNKPIQ
jgi:hypothetical protein